MALTFFSLFSFLLLFSHSVTSNSVIPWTAAHQAPLSSSVSWNLLNSCPLSWWCYQTISSSAASVSFCLQSFPASGSFPVSRLFVSGGQSIGASASASVLPMNIQDWFPLGLTGLISLQCKGLSKVFSNTTAQNTIQEQIKDSSFLLKGTQSPGGNKMHFAFLLNNLPLLDSLIDSSMWLWGLWLILWPASSLKSGIESSKFFCI